VYSWQQPPVAHQGQQEVQQQEQQWHPFGLALVKNLFLLLLLCQHRVLL